MEMETNLSDEPSLNFLSECVGKIEVLVQNLCKQQVSENLTTLYQELLDNIKTLRNNCAKGNEYQNYIVSLPKLFDFLGLLWPNEITIFHTLSKNQNHSIKLLLWQLVANLCVNNKNTQDIVWRNCNVMLTSCLHKEVSQLTDIQLMVLYNFSRSSNIDLHPKDIFLIIIQVWSNYLENQNNEINLEFLHIFFEDFLCSNNRTIPFYAAIDAEKRILVLKYISPYIRNGNPNNKIQKNLMEYLSKEFKKKSDCILRTNTDHVNEINPKEVLALLDVIAVATGDETYTNIYSNDHSLFINVGSLLQCLNEIGQNTINIFTPMEKLNEVAPNSNINSNYENDISYQLRTQLVRTLANLLYRNKKNQEYARELKIITAILGCTRLDARNPMIKEWSILAIRNLCENCPQNQELISNLCKISNVPNDTLNELNLEMGSLRIKPDVLDMDKAP